MTCPNCKIEHGHLTYRCRPYTEAAVARLRGDEVPKDTVAAPARKWERYGYIGSQGLCRVRAFVGEDRCGRRQYQDVPIDEADAKLIAAAPEMLETLKACRMHIETLERMHDHELPEGEMLRAAIAKATGEFV